MSDAPVVGLDPGGPLSQPTRARLFALLLRLSRSAGTAELADRLALHPNGVRRHLEQLEQAGLIERTRLRHGRGRPSDVWSVAPDATPVGGPPGAYRDLGRWLARALAARPAGLPAIRKTGREIGREIAPSEADAPASGLRISLASLGFQPTITRHQDDQLLISLGNCPYRDAVRENQPAVCALHEGVTQGLLDILAPAARLTAFVPHDPDRAGCQLEVSRLPEATG